MNPTKGHRFKILESVNRDDAGVIRRLERVDAGEQTARAVRVSPAQPLRATALFEQRHRADPEGVGRDGGIPCSNPSISAGTQFA